MKGRGCATFSNVQENLFYGGELAATKTKKTKKDQGYYWVTTRLLRESGPWYAGAVNCPEEVLNIMREHLDLENADREHFIVIYLDRKGNVNAINTVSIGGLSNTIVHPREVFKTALLTSSSSIVLCHNHPSGDPTPSKEDIDITRRLCNAGEIMGVDVLDHVIVGVNRYTSLKETGLM